MKIPIQICDKNQIRVDTYDAFVTTQRFDMREDVIRWIKEVGTRNKVIVIITLSDTETRKIWRNNKVIFDCDKDGKYKDTNSETQSETKKRGCPLKIRLTPAKYWFGWKIDVKCGLLNHGLPGRLEGHSFVGRLSTYEKQHVVDLTKRHLLHLNTYCFPCKSEIRRMSLGLRKYISIRVSYKKR